jgi:ketosteroid isomerase-like protein
MPDTDEQLARDFLEAIERCDLTALRRIYAPDALIWHNTDNAEQTPEQNIAVLANFPQLFRWYGYRRVRRIHFGGGYVQQHVFAGIKPSGEEFEVPACIVVQTRNGRIQRMDEYYDSGQDARPEEYRDRAPRRS